MTLPAGTVLGPYEVLASLGVGGMGEVLRARDTRLGREVAIKLVHPRFAADAERLSRFEQEARAASQLDHPNILIVHDVGSHNGSPYIVSELLEGESLRGKLGAPLPPRKAVEYAIQAARCLAAAHEKGIVHRDLKPGNLFVTRDGRIKILDFGVAKLTQPATPSARLTEAITADPDTEPGVVVGTVGYMSPEQVQGKPLDGRSDIFSLGVILYEMLSGKRPFHRQTAPETMVAILKEEPPDLSETNDAVPRRLGRIVRHCLEKEPGSRFQSAEDLCFDLETLSTEPIAGAAMEQASEPRRRLLWWVLTVAANIGVVAVAVLQVRHMRAKPPPTVPPAARIVVLPFQNLGGPEDGYFAAGITDEITNRLASVRRLAVISRTTATEYSRRGKTVGEIGKDLGVGYVLEGSVRWDKRGGGPGRVRITLQLIRVSDDTQLWTARYDRQLSDIFAIQGEVADGVVRALNLTLAPSEATALRRVPTRDLEAYDLYLRALDLERVGGRSSAIAEQIRLASTAVERDPQFGAAQALLAKARLMNYWLYFDRRESELERARVEAERAVALRPDSAETHLALGYYHYMARLDYDAALAELEKALALQPHEDRVHSAIGAVRRRQGKMEAAEAEFQKAFEGDPRSGTISFLLGQTQLLLRKYPEAIRSLELSSSLNPTFAEAYADRAWAHVQWHGDVAAAERVLQAASTVPGLEDTGGSLDYLSVRTAFVARNWSAALRHLDEARPAVFAAGLQFEYVPRSLLRAEVQSDMGHAGPARESFEEARRVLTAKITETPSDARLHSSLGIALAGLGRTTEAVREGKRAIELMPPARDAYRGAFRVEDLARIYTMVGDHPAALALLEAALSRPSLISVSLLRLDPRWDPLRKNPKFQALLAKYEARPANPN